VDRPTSRQAATVAGLLERTFAGDLLGTWVHGSAVLAGTLRPTSDLDLLALVRRSATAVERRALVEGLLDVSGRRARVVAGRPVELTVVVHGAVRPWRFPPVADFQYGEWRRSEYEAGLVPEPATSPDLALLLEVARGGAGSQVGPPLADLVDPVPGHDVLQAALDGVPALLDDLDDDTRNVLLTLARVWVTTTTGEVVTKDAAASWAAARLPEHADLLSAARAGYLERADYALPPTAGDARACAQTLVQRIEEAGRRGR
jgi:streptomycin 3"-adenylyltransferase